MTSKRRLGDLTSDAIKTARMDRLSNAYYKITKKECNCEQNRKKLNNLHDKVEDLISAKRKKAADVRTKKYN